MARTSRERWAAYEQRQRKRQNIADLVTTTLRGLGRIRFSRLSAEVKEMADFRMHDWDKTTCRTCGVEVREFRSNPAGCTGNAYVCRVARKLFDHPEFNRRSSEMLGADYDARRGTFRGWRPWELSPGDFQWLVFNFLKWFAVFDSESVRGLYRAIPDNPGVCAVLADALEEANCTDEKLLEALRTT